MGGVYPCPLSFELSFSTVPRQFPQDLLGAPSAFVLLFTFSLLCRCFLTVSSRLPVRPRCSDLSRLCHGLRCPTAKSRLRSCRSFNGSNIHKLQPVKTLGGSPFEKSAVYIKAACPRFRSIYSQK